ncbi:MraY family glycosyltransferase [Pyrodictium occultum]|uniref:MraY family glycosyltransferase n=1 Tax=Pyrodictium occultum TaxID=2309 RepID=UPI001F1A4689|nr:glycosyltransferase 4 family protein [Pyrodictium occultum]
MTPGEAAYLLASAAVAFTLVIVVEPAWIRVARERGLVGRDMNKPGRVMVAEAGGIWAVVAAAFGLLTLEALYTYLGGGLYRPAELFALVALLLLSSVLGFVDDILGWKKGLPRWQRVVFMAPVSLPLVVIKAGHSRLELPLIGAVDLGLAYPLVAVPIGVLGAANAFNMIAGFNGLEAGMGLLLMLFTAAYAYMKKVYFVLQGSVIMAAALAGFLVYNWYPARVFPGNGFTYGVGAYYAALVIIGNMEKFGLFLFTLYFIKALLNLRGYLHHVWKPGVIEDFGVPLPDGTLDSPLEGIYTLTHAVIKLLKRLKGSAREPEVVAVILVMQALIGIAALILAARGIL